MKVRNCIPPLAGVLLALAAAPAAQVVVVFVGPSGGVGDLWVLNETENQLPGRPAALQGIQLLPIDATGRTELARLLPDQTLLREDVPGASRLVLPGDQGSLFRFRRDGADGADFGFFRVTSAGPQVLVELAGTGAAGSDDPVLGRISVSPSGDAFAFATTPAEGGNVYDVELFTGHVTQRTKQIPPLDIHPDGLCLLATWGAVLSDQGLHRFPRTFGAQAEAVAFPGPLPSWIGGEFVSSQDGSTIAFAAGDTATSAFVFTAGLTGAAVQATTTPQSIVGGGFLPEVERGPMMALSADGSRVAYTARVPEPGGTDLTLELFVREVAAPTAVPEEQLTRDANFEDTLNDSGVIAFVGEDLVVFMAGEDEGGGMEQADVFQAELATPTGEPVFTNLTATLGQVQTPFDYGRLHSEDGVFLAPEGSALIVHDRGGFMVPGRLLHVRTDGTAPQVLLDEVKEIDLAVNAGVSMYLTVERTFPARNLIELPTVGPHRVSPAIHQTPTRLAANRGNGRFAAVLGAANVEFLGRIRPSAPGSLFTLNPLGFGPSLDVTPSGAVVTSVVTRGAAFFVRWGAGNSFRFLWPHELDGFILPAN